MRCLETTVRLPGHSSFRNGSPRPAVRPMQAVQQVASLDTRPQPSARSDNGSDASIHQPAEGTRSGPARSFLACLVFVQQEEGQHRLPAGREVGRNGVEVEWQLIREHVGEETLGHDDLEGRNLKLGKKHPCVQPARRPVGLVVDVGVDEPEMGASLADALRGPFD